MGICQSSFSAPGGCRASRKWPGFFKSQQITQSSVRNSVCPRLPLGSALQVGEAGLKLLAKHAVHTDEYLKDFRNEGRWAAHCPSDARGVTLRLQRELCNVVPFDRLEEIQFDRYLRRWRNFRNFHAPLAYLGVALPLIHGALTHSRAAIRSPHRRVQFLPG